MKNPAQATFTFFQLSLPVLFLVILIIYGLIIRPLFLGQEALPLEMIFISAAILSALHLVRLGFSWNDIQTAMIQKLSRALPTILILFAIGLIIGSWIVSGTIPMLVYYGIKYIDPRYLYVLAFLIPAIFSTFTGTSWGSAGTIGIVLIGVAMAVHAPLGIVAGAIIGGSFFGDKLSPLSDTTNIAALATEVELYDHVHSMLFTTVPSAFLSLLTFFALGFIYPIDTEIHHFQDVDETLQSIESMFHFHPILILPPIFVLFASIRKKPTLPTLIFASLLALFLAFLFQDYSLSQIIQTAYKGFSHTMYSGTTPIGDNIQILFDRGGLYELNDPVIISLMVFIFLGSTDLLGSMPAIVNRLFLKVKKKSLIILSSLFSTAFTNAMTSNQYATSFVIGDAFKSKYDELGIHRKVLSRSIEDYGTMVESLIPWTTTTVFMTATLNVPFAEYWHWQLLSLFNLVVAPLLAIMGIACFPKKLDQAHL